MLAGKPTMQSTICRDDGEWTNDSEETLSVLLNAHFPGCTEVTDLSSITLRTLVDEDRDIITYERVEWAINSFQPYKSPGPDGIFPALLQHCKRKIIPWLVMVYRGCLTK